MKQIVILEIGRLTNLEFGQHLKSIRKNIIQLGIGTVIVDIPLQNYLNIMGEQMKDYDRAMVYIAKSDETAKIEAADAVRDDSITAIVRHLSVFETSKDVAEKLAYASLDTLFNAYKGIQRWNFEEETNGIHNLVEDLNGIKYLPHVTLLGMGHFVTRLTDDNTAFSTLFGGRTQEVAGKEVFNAKEMRNAMKEKYKDMYEYVLSLAKVYETDVQYEKSLNVINAVRHYYATLLAKRKPTQNDEIPDAIPPMEEVR